MAAGNKKRQKQTRQKRTPDGAASMWQERKLDALDTWREAVSAWGETTTWDNKGRMRSGNIELMAGFVKDFLEGLPELLHSAKPIPPDDLVDVLREVLRGVIGVLRLQHANLQPRPKHRPKGDWGRWHDPNYMAAALAEGCINAWKAKAGERRISDKETRAGVVAQNFLVWIVTVAMIDPTGAALVSRAITPLTPFLKRSTFHRAR